MYHYSYYDTRVYVSARVSERNNWIFVRQYNNTCVPEQMSARSRIAITRETMRCASCLLVRFSVISSDPHESSLVQNPDALSCQRGWKTWPIFVLVKMRFRFRHGEKIPGNSVIACGTRKRFRDSIRAAFWEKKKLSARSGPIISLTLSCIGRQNRRERRDSFRP